MITRLNAKIRVGKYLLNMYFDRVLWFVPVGTYRLEKLVKFPI